MVSRVYLKNNNSKSVLLFSRIEQEYKMVSKHQYNSHLSLVAFPCTNVALNKIVVATTASDNLITSRRLTTGELDKTNCLQDKMMNFPEVEIDFDVATEVSLIHIFLNKKSEYR